MFQMIITSTSSTKTRACSARARRTMPMANAAATPPFCSQLSSAAGRLLHCVGSRSRTRLANSLALLSHLPSGGFQPPMPPAGAGSRRYEPLLLDICSPHFALLAITVRASFCFRHVAPAGMGLALLDAPEEETFDRRRRMPDEVGLAAVLGEHRCQLAFQFLVELHAGGAQLQTLHVFEQALDAILLAQVTLAEYV